MTKLIYRSCVLVLFFVSISFPQTEIEKIADISLAPVSTFKNSCARCHGDEGSAYGKTFGKLSPDSLHFITEDMMYGPGGLNPSKLEVNVMADYNKSLPGKNPFGTVLNLKSFLDGKDKLMKIETSPGTELKVDDKNVEIKEQNEIYELYFDPLKIKHLKISLLRNGIVSTLNYPDEIWTK